MISIIEATSQVDLKTGKNYRKWRDRLQKWGTMAVGAGLLAGGLYGGHRYLSNQAKNYRGDIASAKDDYDVKYKNIASAGDADYLKARDDYERNKNLYTSGQSTDYDTVEKRRQALNDMTQKRNELVSSANTYGDTLSRQSDWKNLYTRFDPNRSKYDTNVSGYSNPNDRYRLDTLYLKQLETNKPKYGIETSSPYTSKELFKKN